MRLFTLFYISFYPLKDLNLNYLIINKIRELRGVAIASVLILLLVIHLFVLGDEIKDRVWCEYSYSNMLLGFRFHPCFRARRSRRVEHRRDEVHERSIFFLC